jgi:hypothetical protein
MGQRVLQPIVNQQVSNVLNALDKQVTAAAPSASDGTGGAEEGISPLSPESYSEEPHGPTTSTEDPR